DRLLDVALDLGRFVGAGIEARCGQGGGPGGGSFEEGATAPRVRIRHGEFLLRDGRIVTARTSGRQRARRWSQLLTALAFCYGGARSLADNFECSRVPKGKSPQNAQEREPGDDRMARRKCLNGRLLRQIIVLEKKTVTRISPLAKFRGRGMKRRT